MSLAKILSLNSISVLIKMVSLLIVNKMIAVFVGPSGYAAIAQLQNIISMIQASATAGAGPCVVKYTAEYANNKKEYNVFLSTVFLFCLVLSLVISLALFFSSNLIAIKYLNNVSYEYYLKVLSLSLFFIVLNTLIMSIINGKQLSKYFVTINIISSLISLVYSCILIFFYELQGALIYVVSGQVLVSTYLIYSVSMTKAVDLEFLKYRPSIASLKKIGAFSGMVLLPALLWPFTYSLIRSDLTLDLGADYAGNWDAMWKLSTIYLTLITTVLSIYYLPRFSSIVSKKDIFLEIIHGYKLILPCLLVLCICIYSLRTFIVDILFSNSFSNMLELFYWQLVGDFLKITAWLISYTFLAKAMIKTQIFLEIFLCCTFYISSVYFVDSIGFEGVAIAHACNNLVMLLIVILIFYKKDFKDTLR